MVKLSDVVTKDRAVRLTKDAVWISGFVTALTVAIEVPIVAVYVASKYVAMLIVSLVTLILMFLCIWAWKSLKARRAAKKAAKADSSDNATDTFWSEATGD